MDDHHNDLHARVKRGAALLDQHYPGWAEKINQKTLDMISSCRCILGQLYGDFWTGKAHLFSEGHDKAIRHTKYHERWLGWVDLINLRDVRTHGFMKPNEWDERAWKDLRDAWLIAIHDRCGGSP